MSHHTPLIATIVAGLVLAFIFGALANRLRLPPLVGYLLAGVVVGPETPGFVADQNLATELAEMGVILLMFGVGLHFSLKELLAVRAIAIPGAVVQIAAATLMGAGLAWLMDWPLGGGLVFGLALSVASTVVLLRALQERRLIDTDRGRIAVGWLIVEDLAMVLALVLLPALSGVLGGATEGGGDSSVATVLALTLAKVAAFVALMLVIGRRIIPWLLHHIAHTGSRELFRLAVLAIALGVAFGAAKLFGVSFALGAFFAGMIMSESELSHRAAEESLPLRDAFAVLFFVSVGMLFDPAILWKQPGPVLATLFIILIGKSFAAYVIVRAFKYPVGTGLMIAASLAQIGEFSFILADMGVGLNLLPKDGRDLILAGSIISMMLNPAAFYAAEKLRAYLERGKTAAPDMAPPDTVVAPLHQTALTGHTVLVGFGRVGSLVGEGLKGLAQAFVVIEDSDKAVAQAKSMGAEVVEGNAAKEEVLRAANIAQARRLILAIPNAFEGGQTVMKAKAANPSIIVIARAHSDDEVDYLKKLGAAVVIMGEREIAKGIVDHIQA